MEHEASSFDLIVIGAGAAGSTVAGEAVGRGARVAMIERWKVGGTCLNVGCDPTKTMVRSAEVLHLARTAQRFGIAVDGVHPDWPAVMRRVEWVIDTIRGGDGDKNVRESGVVLFKEQARFRSAHELEVGDQVLRGDKIIIAAGAEAVIPPIEGLRDAGYLTNREAVSLPTLPPSLAIVGGGVIAVEFAQIFARFGVAVTILNSRDRILPREEPVLSEALQDVLRAEGIRIEQEVRVRRVERHAEGTRIFSDRNGEPVVTDAAAILLATGRAPATEGLKLEAAGVEYDKSGIVVNAELQTSAPHIYAVGDVVANGYPFTHVADYHAHIAEHNAMSGLPSRRVDYHAVPWAVFTDPELGRVGMTEASAIEAGHDVVCATVQMRDLARAITADERGGLVKLVADRVSGQLLGGHILAARGGELLGEVALALRLRLPVSALCETIHAYPTLSEAVYWAAYELAKPDTLGHLAVSGVQRPIDQAQNRP